jgi:hypothetical protein
MNNWFAYNDGRSAGEVGKEGGVILRDDEHKLGARITLKREVKYISISCRIYKRIDHSRFFSMISDADREYRSMKTALGNMMIVIDAAGGDDIKVWEAISEFVRQFP